MRYPLLIIAALSTAPLVLAGCGLVRPGTRQPEAARIDQARAEFTDESGRRVGEARLVQTPHGVLITADFSSLPPGTHAMHIHQVGRCESPFESAGDHFNPGGRSHGFRNANGPHAGDLPNIYVPERGTLRVELVAPGISLQGANTVFDADGSALVVHAFGDDYVTDPSGGSGTRIACGVIRG